MHTRKADDEYTKMTPLKEIVSNFENYSIKIFTLFTLEILFE